MEIGNKTAERFLKKYGYSLSYPNILALKDEVESEYDREDYASLEDLMDDAINELESINRLTKMDSPLNKEV